MKRQSVLCGSLWLIGSAAAAKILGAVYRIPLTAMLGGTGMGYYSCAYGLFLPVFALSVTGINTACATLTAQALAAGQAERAEQLHREALRMFGTVGAGAAAVVFLLAEPLCALLHNEGAAPAVRCFAPAVFFCCVNAVLRGRFEGQHRMTPTAVSQLAEGIVRLAAGLLFVAWVFHRRERFAGHLWESAAAAAISGVTLSTLAGTLTMLCFPAGCKPVPRGDVHTLRKDLLRVLLPVAAASAVTNLTTLVDLVTGLRLLEKIYPGANATAQANFAYGAYSGLAVTVFNLVPSVTNMLGKGVLPAFAEDCVQGDKNAMRREAEVVLQRTAMLAVPAGMGLVALAKPVLGTLFSSRPAECAAAEEPLRVLGIAVMFSALGYPLFSMMQAAGHAGKTVRVMLWGALIKLLGNLFLVPCMGLTGIAWATVVCYGAVFAAAAIAFQHCTGVQMRYVRVFWLPVMSGVLCGIAAQAVYGQLVWVMSGRAALVCAAASGGIFVLLGMAGIRKTG